MIMVVRTDGVGLELRHVLLQPELRQPLAHRVHIVVHLWRRGQLLLAATQHDRGVSERALTEACLRGARYVAQGTAVDV